MNLSGVIARASAILLRPREEWPVIAGESATPASIYTGYLMLLAAVPAVVGLIDSVLLGYSLPVLGTMRLGLGAGLQNALVSYVVSLAGVFVFSLIVNALAPTFGGQRDSLAALKVSAYSATVGMVASVGQLVPWLGGLIALAGLVYGIYVFYLGLPPTMKCPPGKAAGYAAVSILVALVAGALFWGLIGRSLLSVPGLDGASTAVLGRAGDADDIKVEPGSPLGKLEQMGKEMEAAARKLEEAEKSGDQRAQAEAVGALVGAAMGAKPGATALPPETMRGFLPESLGGLARLSVESERNAAVGIQVSRGEARYGAATGEGPEISLEITDLGGAQGMMMLAAWAGIEMERESEDGYEKTYRDAGRVIHEEWNRSARRGEYSLVVAERFLVKLEGRRLDMPALKAAAEAIDLGALEALKGEGG